MPWEQDVVSVCVYLNSQASLTLTLVVILSLPKESLLLLSLIGFFSGGWWCEKIISYDF